MKAHIVTIGDEILIGQTINTNAAFIGTALTDIHVTVNKTSVVGDDVNCILREFKDAFAENDVVIVTGGLGPTHDDVTRDCVVRFFNTELVLNTEVLEDVKRIFTKRGRELTKVNEDQALVPAICKVIRNQLGTAPGFWIEQDKKYFIVMPGVPFEMYNMMHEYVIPNLKELSKETKVLSKRVNLMTTGIPESYLYERLGNIEELLQGAKLAFLPNQFGVKLRITVSGESEEELNNKISEIVQKIRSKAGRYIYANEEIELEKVVGRLMKDRGLTISVAESCTGGNIANMLTDIAGSSAYFERGVVTYSNGSKVELLKVDEDTLGKYGAVSQEVAMQMAEGIRSISGTDIGLSITGILGPTGATAGKPVGLVYIGFCDEKICTAKKFVFGDDRKINKERASQAALEMVRRYILGINFDD